MVENPLKDRRDWRIIGKASGLGCSIVASLLMCVVGGVTFDRWADTLPIFTLAGIVLGIATAGYLLYELAVISQPDKGLLGRQRTDESDRRNEPDE